MVNQNAELKTNLFEELSDEEMEFIVGGVAALFNGIDSTAGTVLPGGVPGVVDPLFPGGVPGVVDPVLPHGV